MARTFQCIVLAWLLLGPTRESRAGIVLVRNDSFMEVPGDSAIRYDLRQSSVPIASSPVVAFAPDAADYYTLLYSLYDPGPPPVGIPAGANQQLYLQPDAILGSGSAEAQYGYVATTPFEVHSTLDVTFEVTTPSWFVLSGALGGAVGDVEGAYLRSFTSTLGTNPALVETKDGPFKFFEAGLLIPGVDYRLFFSSSEVPFTGYAFTSWGFALTVPEPALPLELAGLLVLAFVLRRAVLA